MDKGPALTSSESKKYCEKENIYHNPITTGLMGGNGHIEIQHKTLNPILTKTKHKPATKLRHVDTLQIYLVMHITYNEMALKSTKAKENNQFISSIKSAASEAPVADFIMRNIILYKFHVVEIY